MFQLWIVTRRSIQCMRLMHAEVMSTVPKLADICLMLADAIHCSGQLQEELMFIFNPLAPSKRGQAHTVATSEAASCGTRSAADA
jgi:hypothetical protein